MFKMFKKILPTPRSKLLEVLAFWFLSLWFALSWFFLAEYNILKSIVFIADPPQATPYDWGVVLIYMIFTILVFLIVFGFILLTMVLILDTLDIIMQFIKQKRRKTND